MNMKKVVYILIGIMLVAFGVGFLSLNISGNRIDNIFSENPDEWEANAKDLDEKAVESIDGMDEIYIKANCAKVSVSSEDREDVSINYYGKLSSSIKTSLTTKPSGGKLIIDAKAKNNYKINFGSNMNLYLDIILPTSYTNDLNIETDLGSININGLELNNLEVESSLGEIKIENTSGDLEVETNLGSIDLDYDNLDWNIDAKSDLGSIKITLPKKSNFTIDAETELGSIKSNFPLNTKEEIKDTTNSKLKGIAGNGENNISLSVELGSIDIKSK